MTEEAGPARQSSPQSDPADFLEIWRESFSQVLGQITGSALPCALEKETPGDLTTAVENDLWVVITSSGALRGEMSLRLTAAAMLALAQIFMSEPATPEAELTTDHREAAVELLRQISGIVSTAAKGRWGELQLAVEIVPAAPLWPPAAAVWLRIGNPGVTGTLIEFGLSAALVAQLREKTDAAKTEAAKAALASSKHPTPSDSMPGTGTLDLLMDVQLALTLRFGSKTLLLREVLDLSPGAVVELDRKVQEPVELLLDGRLIARGEVVVIEGNYGLRVTEVSSIGNA
jgi:flagellar motor switch protein FliN/FliY